MTRKVDISIKLRDNFEIMVTTDKLPYTFFLELSTNQ